MRNSLLLSAAALLVAASVAMAGPPKVDICHRPPGNPTNIQRISVGAAAVAGHLAHGDTEPGICGCGFDGFAIPQCGGRTALCVPASCAVGCVSCCPPCPGCPEPEPGECDGANCSCDTDCGCFEVGLTP